MDVPKRLQGGLCDNGCHHYFRRAKIAFDAGAPKIAQSRVSEGLSAINNCRVHEARRQALAAPEEEIDREDARDAEDPTESSGVCGPPALAPGAPDEFSNFLALFGRLLQAEQDRVDHELADYRTALLVEIGDVGGQLRP
jgi:hypothetical protein